MDRKQTSYIELRSKKSLKINDFWSSPAPLGNVLELTLELFLMFLQAPKRILIAQPCQERFRKPIRTFLGGFLCCVFVLFIVFFIEKSLLLSLQDTYIIFGMGALTFGLGISLITSSAPYLSAPDVSIFMLAESILGPLWPWFFLGEKITTMELIGGVLILLSLFILFIFGNDGKHLIRS